MGGCRSSFAASRWIAIALLLFTTLLLPRTLGFGISSVHRFSTTTSSSSPVPFLSNARFGVLATSHQHSSFQTPTSTSSSSRTALAMAPIMGGLEQREGPTPTAGGMTLYCKAGPDGTSVGDCPFAHFVRLVLHEKNLDYELRPSTAETKPTWLVEQYQGKMPALRHRQECYVESDVIVEYLDFFFPSTPPMKPKSSASNKEWQKATEAVDGFFPAVAKYLKHTPDGDEEDLQWKANVQAALQKLEQHLQSATKSPLFLVGEHVTLLDASLVPKLYHLQTGIQGFKGEHGISIEQEFPLVQAYLHSMMARPSFQETLYPTDTILWGWGNARSAA